jgi:hypothetical protein
MIRCKFCRRQHRSYNAIARCKFKRAAWVDGEGPWGLIAWCGEVTISLWETREEAEKAKQSIDQAGCGGRCTKDHTIWDFR